MLFTFLQTKFPFLFSLPERQQSTRRRRVCQNDREKVKENQILQVFTALEVHACSAIQGGFSDNLKAAVFNSWEDVPLTETQRLPWTMDGHDPIPRSKYNRRGVLTNVLEQSSWIPQPSLVTWVCPPCSSCWSRGARTYVSFSLSHTGNPCVCLQRDLIELSYIICEFIIFELKTVVQALNLRY